MTRKDYILIAEALKESSPGNDPGCLAMFQHRSDCKAVADALAKDNRRFDRALFLRNCGVQP